MHTVAKETALISPRRLALSANSSRGRRAHILRRLFRNRGATVGFVILLALVITSVIAPILAPANPNSQDISKRLIPPFQNNAYPLGTDQLGREVVSRLIFGSRIALIVGLTVVAISGTAGVLLGLLAGFYGGKSDDLISWFGNVFLAFPFILLAVVVVAVLGSGLRNLIIVLSVTSWMSYMRVVRGEVLAVRETAYVEAARVIGASDARLLTQHLLPNIATPVIIIGTFEVARMIISEAALSFLGLGVGASTPSWGSMLADGRTYLATAWWVATLPGIAITITVLAINLLGDWLRDQLDPSLNVR